MSKFGVTIIGAGHMGRIHADGWRLVEDARIVSVVDMNAALAHEMAAQHGARVVADVAEAIADPAVNVVSICTPTFLHPQLALLAAQHGKHVLCEKPIALRLADARAMLDAARAANVQFSVGLMRRHTAILPTLRTWMRAGNLGSPRMAHTVNVMPLRPKRAMHDANANGGPLIDMIVHFVDVWSMLFDAAPVALQAQGMTLAAGRPEIEHIAEKAVDTAAVLVRFSSGDVGNIFVSWGCPPDAKVFQHQETILGPCGRLDLRFAAEEQFADFHAADGSTTRIAESTESMYRREVADFAAAIRNEAFDYDSAEAAITALKVSLGALQSIRTGQMVDIH